MCSYEIYVNVYKYDNVHRFSNVKRVCIFYQPLDRFPVPKNNIKWFIIIRGGGQSIFKIVGATIHSKICYLLLTKETFFFKTQ